MVDFDFPALEYFAASIKWLELVSNKIKYIDALQHSNLRNLRRLYLSNNEIADMTVLQRVCLPLVNYLNIRSSISKADNNRIHEVLGTLLRLQHMP